MKEKRKENRGCEGESAEEEGENAREIERWSGDEQRVSER